MMNQLSQSIQHLLKQLENLVEELSDEQFCLPIPLLGHATIGQHIRHILEFYIELGNGYEIGTIDYNKRKRDFELETNRQTAIKEISQIEIILKLANKDLNINAEFDVEDQQRQVIPTNYYRELMYNLEHTVHHMALIRVGINLIAKLELPPDFGIAAATLKYRNACAQ